eukprot:gnl/TRDRNA2_/TRDRNA2_76619_c0_seq1.p1 gnl/TRDRNA2_/TRDRNA2_76619_c0~~gnl/TRDRNA2_/TRDRNA2_76619_c0_seq1.p1  ORF type:complete len:119 (+),score=16.79 gnl/TRDRNA2_/TRDRNA2_76619_c0_seq1:116-472(+)
MFFWLAPAWTIHSLLLIFPAGNLRLQDGTEWHKKHHYFRQRVAARSQKVQRLQRRMGQMQSDEDYYKFRMHSAMSKQLMERTANPYVLLICNDLQQQFPLIAYGSIEANAESTADFPP